MRGSNTQLHDRLFNLNAFLVNLHPLSSPRRVVDVSQVCDDVQVHHSVEKEYFLNSVRRVLLEQAGVIVAAEELKLLHLTDIVDDCELLSQVRLKAEFDLVTPCHVLAVGTLQDLDVASDHLVDLASPPHSEVGLDLVSSLVQDGDAAADGQTLNVLLDLFG